MKTQERSDTVVVPAHEVHAAAVRALRAHGATASDAATQADVLLEGDLRGQHSHGVRRVPVLAQRLANGVTRSGVTPTVSWLGAGRVHLDGHRGLGPVIAHHALDLIVPAARDTGVAVASIRSAGHLGMLAPYAERLASEGCVGIVLTISEALVAPWGGTCAMVGTNPIGIGVPTEDEPLVLDMSTAAVSAGKILDYAARGQEIPSDWAVDADGRPTTDAEAAAAGAIAPFGGAKGFALGVAIEAVVGALTGSALGRDVHGTLDTDQPPTKGDVLIALPVDRAGGALTAVTDYFRALRQEGRDGARVQIPGDRARTLRAQRRRHGIPLDTQLWDDVTALASA